MDIDPRVRFEPLKETHFDAILAIEAEAYPEAWTRGMFRDELRSRLSVFHVMLRGDEVAGYGGFWIVLDEAHITSVTVRKTDRGKGFGRLLLHFLLDLARERGARLATLELRASNRVARLLYESEGFRQVGLRKGYYSKSNEDAVVMLKEL